MIKTRFALFSALLVTTSALIAQPVTVRVDPVEFLGANTQHEGIEDTQVNSDSNPFASPHAPEEEPVTVASIPKSTFQANLSAAFAQGVGGVADMEAANLTVVGGTETKDIGELVIVLPVGDVSVMPGSNNYVEGGCGEGYLGRECGSTSYLQQSPAVSDPFRTWNIGASSNAPSGDQVISNTTAYHFDFNPADRLVQVGISYRIYVNFQSHRETKPFPNKPNVRVRATFTNGTNEMQVMTTGYTYDGTGSNGNNTFYGIGQPAEGYFLSGLELWSIGNNARVWAALDDLAIIADPVTAPEILGEPTAVSIPIGDPFELEVIASGSEPLSYQWRKNGFALTGATRAQYTVVAATQGDEGLYDCVVSNAGGEVTSEQVVVTVTTTAQAPEVTMDPEDSVVTEGESVNLSASVSGTSPLSYQWRKDGEAIPGATQLTYPIAEAQLSDAGSYTLFVTNVAGTAESEPAILTVEALMGPGIVEGPQELTLREGELLSLSVVASGSGPLSYQWRKDGEPIPGATGATLELLGAALTDSGSYDVLVSNVVGSVTSEAVVVTVNPAAVPPSIREAPVDTQVNEGQAVLLTVLATGTEPLSYQWSKDGVELEGETESSLELGEAQLSDAGSYTVEVTNVEGSLESAPVTVTVNEVIAPAITQAPAGVSVTEGDAVNLSVSVSGTGPFMYQWRKDGEVIAGATGSSLEFESSVVGDSGSYDVVVSNYKGSVTSEAALVAVTVPPMIETDPQGVELIEGDALELGVMVSGSAPFTYQWRQDGVEIAGAVSDTLTINAVGLSSGGDYDVVVSNASGSVTSAVASVTVYPLPSLDLTLIQVGGQLQEQLITVTAVPQVSWTATVEVDWLRIPSGFEGSGNGVVRLVIDANETGEARSATVLIGGVEVLVLQGSLPQSEGFDAIVGASALEGGTYNSAWFGVYSYASSDWIEHTELGWLYIGFATEATNLYLYSLTLQSWVWTNEQFFSVLYDFTRGGYIFYFVVEDGGGYLYDYTTLTWSTL